MNPNGNHKSKTCNRYTKPKRKECKHTTKENNQTTMEETKRKNEQKRLEKQYRNNWKNNKVAIRTYLSIIILDISEPNAPTMVSDWIEKTRPSICYLKEIDFILYIYIFFFNFILNFT